MRIVRRDQKTVLQCLIVVHFFQTKGVKDPMQHLFEEGGIRPLFRAAADLFVIEHTVHGNAFLRLCSKQSLKRGKSALQIIQPPASDELLTSTEHTGLLPVIQKQIPIEDIFLFDGNRFGNDFLKFALSFHGRKKRQHILLRIERISIVDFTVHVNRKVGDKKQIPIQIDQLRCHAFLCPDQHPSRHGQRSVQPWCANHPAIFFHIQLNISLLHLHLRIGFDFKHRGIAVTGDDLKALKRFFRKMKSNERRAVARNKIFASPLQLPVVSLI